MLSAFDYPPLQGFPVISTSETVPRDFMAMVMLASHTGTLQQAFMVSSSVIPYDFVVRVNLVFSRIRHGSKKCFLN